ncbi:nitrate reductase [Agaricicola taiwanensis]|uniref:Nitrate reductase n=1 Tax=Agaricicola taiwanensis TaxID=591372 RepID=A0A8J2YIH1_9RHOB|nr:nitrate reductase [Agaricicola taiwanensis]GGE44471.1 nitrate reductase [Agaricicola taiwanensis]
MDDRPSHGEGLLSAPAGLDLALVDATGTPERSVPDAVRTTCPYCGVGCGVTASVDGTGLASVKGDASHPSNFGRLCSKGSALAETLSLDDRVLHPRIDGRTADWDEALDLVAAKFRSTIAEHGPDAVAFYVSGQLLTEDYYVANKLMKGFIGSGNIDTNSRLCMASSVAGHRRAFGADTVPGTYEDLELTDLAVLVGSNLAWCHPVLFQRLLAAKAARPDMKIVVVDPRRTATAEAADLFLPIAPNGDVALFNGLLSHLAREGKADAGFVSAHTSGLDDALAASAADIEITAAGTGLSTADIATFFQLFAATEKVVTVYSQGVNQSVSGTDKVNAMINCHLFTGRIGRPGMGPFSVTGQPNAMGGREVGGLANQLAAHMDFDEIARDRVARFWGTDRLASRPGLKAVDLFEAVGDGRVKAIWIMGTNPVVSMPAANRVRDALARCPFVVVSDVVSGADTAALAHVLLPAAAWGEKDGTVTNSERRISRQRPFLPLPGDARSDWWIMTQVAQRLGFKKAFAYEGPADIFREHAALSAFENDGTRDFDIGAFENVTNTDYEALEPFQWPAPKGGNPPTHDGRFFATGRFYTSDTRARFIPTPVQAKQDYSGLRLNTGRIRDQWHTMTRTGKTPRLASHIAEPFAELHPSDASQLGVTPAGLVQITSAHGAAVARALVTDRQQPGSVFVPMHWTTEYAPAARIDAAVSPAVDPVSGQPGLKLTDVAVTPFAVAWYGFAASRGKPVLSDLPYAAAARAKGGWRLECAGSDTPDDWTGYVTTLLGLPKDAEVVSYQDAAGRSFRFAAFHDGRLAGAFFAAPEPVAVSRNWIADRLDDASFDGHGRMSLLAGRAGAHAPDQGATVCSCFDVGVNTIIAAISSGAAVTVEAIGVCLKAGTNCGSCRPEIKRLCDGHHLQKTG